MKRQVTLTANLAGVDLGTVTREVTAAVQRAGDPPKGTKVEIRGQIPPMNEMSGGLTVGLVISIVAVFLLLTANFQSVRLALVAVSTAPAVVAGVVTLLWLTGTTLNIQSFIGAIMAIGVAMANAILLVTFAEHAPPRRNRRPSCGRDGCRGPPAGHPDDELRDDRRHAADGAGLWRSRGSRTRRWAGPSSAAWRLQHWRRCSCFPRCLPCSGVAPAASRRRSIPTIRRVPITRPLWLKVQHDDLCRERPPWRSGLAKQHSIAGHGTPRRAFPTTLCSPLPLRERGWG